MKKLLFVVLSLILVGCSQKSMIEKVSESKSHFENVVYEGQDFYDIGKDIKEEKYRIYHQASSGFSGTSGIRRSAKQRANEFCKKIDMNKKMITISEHTAKPPYILGNFPRIEIIFACVDEQITKKGKVQKKDKYEKLSNIKSLFDNGTLTEEEFKKEKRKILEEQ